MRYLHWYHPSPQIPMKKHLVNSKPSVELTELPIVLDPVSDLAEEGFLA